ncbi:ScbR family autoregulator-binding transcription factor [Actinomycetospora sp. TBRC 11914]|uniref:ScbR family autoregulator-binding transcription factor n=1 Tax=Actinomycetospora sp. TBRC 11914 TaxID=2729387 RepID=UPI00145E83A1|nr:ScbR family autoregulator-binding transcription factor [Actinomycetospora sp. TBRC 11914]NMO94021.1 TetR/AcrR family transcriptional regulator [Actinomycetospora sp. TBRC 11914]
MNHPHDDDVPPRSGSDGATGPARAGRHRQPRAAATRHALLVAAGEQFARHGYHATSLNDLLSHGPGSKGALYFHFPSKHAVAAALVEAMTASWDRVVPDAERDTPDALHALIAVTDNVVVRLDDPIVRGGARVLRDQVLEHPTLAETSAEWEDDLARLFTLAARQHLLRPAVDPDWAARELVVSLAGRATLLESLEPKQELWDQMNEFWTGFLPLVAAEAWLAAWDQRSWLTRPRPASGLDG